MSCSRSSEIDRLPWSDGTRGPGGGSGAGRHAGALGVKERLEGIGRSPIGFDVFVHKRKVRSDDLLQSEPRSQSLFGMVVFRLRGTARIFFFQQRWFSGLRGPLQRSQSRCDSSGAFAGFLE